MQLRNLFDDDNAVSPVIGVILMVAITVILAAVIATFVLGLGEQVSQTAPQATFSFDYSEETGSDSPDSSFTDGICDDDGGTEGVLTITHSGGATMTADRISISGASGSDGNLVDKAGGSDNAYSTGEEISAGDDIVVCVEGGDTVNVVWESQSGGDSSILRDWTGPDA